MLELFDRLFSRLREIWDSMSLNQKVISGAVLVALLVTLSYLSTLRGTLTDYTVLFSELDASSASEITARLEQQKVPYRLSSDGAVIEVPRAQATRLRIDLTADGLPSTGILGFEILDSASFGMSERIQDVQIQRALQGELARTLMSLDAVEWANVNLSIPKPTLFTELEEPTTAAVVLKFRRQRRLSQKSIDGLTNLIASAVPGLDPGNVTILDTDSNPLTKTFRDDLAMLSSTQWEKKVQVDKYLASEAKRMLDGAYGSGKALVTVNTELDWDRLERISTIYDPDGNVVQGEESEMSTTPGPDGVGESEKTTVNYKNSQVVENFAKNAGDIKRLTVSVFIDSRDSTWTDANGDRQHVKIPRDESEIAAIRSITEKAVGFDSSRGDMIEVVQSDFDVAAQIAEEPSTAVQATLVEGVRAAMMGLAVLASIGLLFVILRSITSTLDPSRISMKADEEFGKQVQSVREEEEIHESDRDVLVRKIIKTTIEQPDIAAKTIKAFLRGE